MSAGSGDLWQFRRNDQRLEVALSAARLGAWELDLRSRVLKSTAQCKANHGYAADADMQLYPHIVDAVDPSHRDGFVAAIDAAIEGRGSFQIEVPHRWPDGTEHWIFVAGRVVGDECVVGVTQDVTDRHTLQQALRAKDEQYRAIVEAANEGIWRLDRDARIVFVNQRMAQMLGLSTDQMVGRYKWDFVFAEDVPLMQALFGRRQQGVSEELADIRFRHEHGREVWTLMSARPLYDDTRTFVGAVDLFTDITERRKAEQELRDVDRRKDDFLAVLGHELRAPLAPILMAVKLLEMKGPRDQSLQKLRDTIFRQTQHLSALVDELLDVGRIAAGKLRLDVRRLDLRGVVKQAVEVALPVIERRQHTLSVDLPDAPFYADADSVRLVQVTANLLSNAAKYSPGHGHIHIALREDHGMGVVSVRDTGVGLPADMLHRVFDRFVQVSAASDGPESGLGIGLSVVKAIVELHGGTVEAHSDGIGKGSTFTFRVPVAATLTRISEGPAPDAVSGLNPSASLRRARDLAES